MTSSNHPRWDRNLNTGRLAYESAEAVTARQRIHVGPSYPSRLDGGDPVNAAAVEAQSGSSGADSSSRNSRSPSGSRSTSGPPPKATAAIIPITGGTVRGPLL